LFFAAYGKPFRKITKNQLINSINKKEVLVELELERGDTEYMVRRGIKPNVFDVFVDGSKREQEANLVDVQEWFETNVLKMNFKAASQVVVLGSASFVPFMELQANHRREVIEDLLDVQVFGIMNNQLKDRIQVLTAEMSETNTAREILAAKIASGEKFLKSVEDDVEQRVLLLKGKISTLEDERKKKATEGISLVNQISDLKKKLEGMDEIKSSISTMDRQVQALSAYQETIVKDKLFFAHNESCLSCKQKISKEYATQARVELENSFRGAQKELDEIQPKLQEARKTLAEMYKIETEISDLNMTSRIVGDTITGLTKRIAEHQAEIDENRSRVKADASDVDLDSLRDELNKLDSKRAKQAKTREIMGTAGALLKDGGVKASVIKQYIPLMNQLINKYLADLEFFCEFHLDEEFKETVKSRGRDDFSYESFSEGEKMRINLAILFAWRQIAKLRNTAATNIVIMDEIFDSSLDLEGADYFVALLATLSKESNAIIISHRTDQLSEKFDRAIKFVKNNNFSSIAEE
jgi:chromosome segregation ATPase